MNTGNPIARAALNAAGYLVGLRRAPPIPGSFRNILVVRQHDQLGDMMCIIPTLRSLHDRYPGSVITLVASPVNHEIMLEHPFLDRVILFDKRAILRSAGGFLKFIRQLRSVRYDLAIVPATVSVSLTSGIIARLSGAPFRIGPGRLEFRDNPSKFLFTHPVDLDWSGTPGKHQSLRNADILAPLKLAPSEPAYVLGLTPGEDAHAVALLATLRRDHRLVFGIHPGAAKQGNRWPAERFAEIARRLHDEFHNGLIVTIGPKDAEILGRLAPLLDVPHVFVRNEPIRNVAAVINRLDFFISNDTGPLHIAGALSPPVLGLFGPTDPKQWAPPGKKNRYIASSDGKIGSIGTDEVLAVSRVILSRQAR
ncbi:MAG TPA: glycosyltransferase family 9 protein [Bacteroidota bacterium]|nr:glycosyltransferase family 9 protein [Bacteroidota bacterium]